MLEGEISGDILDPDEPEQPKAAVKPSKKPKKERERDDELGEDDEIVADLVDLYPSIDKAFLDSADRINDQMDYWDIYNCDTSAQQFYQGNSQIFMPFVRDAIDARVTRFTNQVFPASGHNVDVVTPDGDLPFELMALGEHYIMASNLRSQVIPALLKNGDVEGHWNLYVSWDKRERHVTSKVMRGPKIDDIEVPEAGEFEDVEEEVISAARPYVEVIPDSDVMVLPAIADSIEDALAMGGSVTILRRWSKQRIKDMIEDGDFIEERAEQILDAMQSDKSRTDAKKKHVDAAGIVSAGKYCLGYETWKVLEVDGVRRLCRAYYGAPDLVLGCKINPYWCDLCPLISAPQDKISGVFKGTSPVKKVATLQYAANDYENQGCDSATYGLLPIIMTDPISNPRVGSMVLDLAAVWEVNPQTTKFAEFPKLYQDAEGLVASKKAQIFQSLGVNPSMIPGNTGGKSKRNQAEIANEQAVDVLTTADVVTALEASILTPTLQRFFWYDAQFRDADITVKAYGRAGMKAEMQVVPPIQMNTRYWFKWLGVESARNAQQQQQNISLLNVLNGIPPQKYPGREMDLVPLIEQIVGTGLGSRLAPLVFRSLVDKLSIPAEKENEMLVGGFDLPTAPSDDDAQHIQVHNALMAGGPPDMMDPKGVIRIHIMKHMQQMQAKQMQQQQQAQGEPGKPGGAGPGVAGTPQPGAQPAGPHAAKQPPGAVHPDQMANAMPRKF